MIDNFLCMLGGFEKIRKEDLGRDLKRKRVFIERKGIGDRSNVSSIITNGMLSEDGPKKSLSATEWMNIHVALTLQLKAGLSTAFGSFPDARNRSEVGTER